MDIISSTSKKFDFINDFSINTNPVGLPDMVMNNAEKIIQLGEFYPDPDCLKLRASLAKKYHNNPQNILCGNGASDLIFRLITAVNPQESLIITPTYEEYEEILSLRGSKIDHYQLNLDNEKHYVVDRLLEKINSNLGLLVICNPNNPTGTLFSIEDLEKIIYHSRHNNVYVIIDESFIEFLPNWPELTVKRLIDKYANLIIIDGFTKFFALAGFRVGFAITSNNDLLNKMSNIGPAYNVSTISQIAARFALQDKKYIEKTYSLLKSEQKYLALQMSQLPIKLISVSANFILFYSEQADLRESLLELKIKTRDCSKFVGLNSKFHRVAIKTHEDNKKFILALKQVLENN